MLPVFILPSSIRKLRVQRRMRESMLREWKTARARGEASPPLPLILWHVANMGADGWAGALASPCLCVVAFFFFFLFPRYWPSRPWGTPWRLHRYADSPTVCISMPACVRFSVGECTQDIVKVCKSRALITVRREPEAVCVCALWRASELCLNTWCVRCPLFASLSAGSNNFVRELRVSSATPPTLPALLSKPRHGCQTLTSAAPVDLSPSSHPALIPLAVLCPRPQPPHFTASRMYKNVCLWNGHGVHFNHSGLSVKVVSRSLRQTQKQSY